VAHGAAARGQGDDTVRLSQAHCQRIEGGVHADAVDLLRCHLQKNGRHGDLDRRQPDLVPLRIEIAQRLEFWVYRPQLVGRRGKRGQPAHLLIADAARPVARDLEHGDTPRTDVEGLREKPS
jgi:hypothetical protein